MPKGRAVRRLESALGVVGILALLTTYLVITGWNPVPGFLDWLDRAGSLSRPEPGWKTRASAKPEYAVVAGQAVVVIMRGAVEARANRTGEKIWSREAAWAAIAGADSSAVVVIGRGAARGYEVVDPTTGAVQWEDAEALGVWTYRNMILSMTCQGTSNCMLAGRAPAGGQVLWSSPVPGVGRSLAGANHRLLGSRDLTAPTVEALASVPGEAPSLLGFPLDGKVQVVDTETGRRVREAEASENVRVVVVGGRVLHSRAERRQGQCRYALEAQDPATGQSVWRKDGYDLRTASGAGCEQRRDPMGGGGTLAAVRGDNRQVLLSAGDGRELWVGGPGEQALATDGFLALVRTADGKLVKAVDLGGRDTLWEQEASGKPAAALTPHAALILEEGRVRVLEPRTGRTLIDAETTARVIGCGTDGIVLSAGRTVGLLPFGAVNAAG